MASAERNSLFRSLESQAAYGPLPGVQLAAALRALVGHRPHRFGSALWPIDRLGHPAVAEPWPHIHLALDTSMLWNRFCVVMVSVVAHGRAIPLLWQTLEHSSASVSASLSIALLEKADQLLSGFGAITLLADRAFPCDELIAWFKPGPAGVM